MVAPPTQRVSKGVISFVNTRNESVVDDDDEEVFIVACLIAPHTGRTSQPHEVLQTTAIPTANRPMSSSNPFAASAPSRKGEVEHVIADFAVCTYMHWSIDAYLIHHSRLLRTTRSR